MGTQRIGILLVMVASMQWGCAAFPDRTAPATAVRIEPHQSVRHGAGEVDVLYARGKRHLTEGRIELARETFARAATLDGGNPEVRNGLAIALANGGDLAGARVQLETAVAAAPAAAHLHANLGYVLMSQGQHKDAARTLHRALTLDPYNAAARGHWETLHQRMSARGESSGAAPEVPTAPAAARAAQPAVVYVAFDRPIGVPIAAPGADGSPSGAGVRPATSGGTAMPRPDRPAGMQLAPERPPTPTPSTREPAATLDAGQTPAASGSRNVAAIPATRVEVANGNGVLRHASRVSQRLLSVRLPVARIANADRFDYPRTRIYYRDGHRAAALALGRMLPVDAQILPMTTGTKNVGIDVRFVVGRDLAASDRVERIGRVPASTVALIDESNRSGR